MPCATRGPAPSPAPGRRGVAGAGPRRAARRRLKAAQDLAFAPRGKTSLASFLASDVPELGVAATVVVGAGTGENELALKVALAAVVALVGLGVLVGRRRGEPGKR